MPMTPAALRAAPSNNVSTGAKILALAVGGFGVLGCQGPVNLPAPSTGETVAFGADIQPIFDAHCTTCHRVGGQADIAGIPLKLVSDVAYDLLVGQPSTQQADITLVVPGDASSSLLFLKVGSDAPPVGSTMPLFGARLSSADLGRIRDWINQGALNN